MRHLRPFAPLAFLALFARDAVAAWPPSPSFTAADMADPANWPNDPNYAYSDSENGQFGFYSFVPAQQPGSILSPMETAAGMSIDLAFRHTIGDPRVIIAITDCGIKWDERDLIEKVHLNHHELVGHEPLHADGTPCGGTGDLAGFDCNGDGVLSVSDYADTPTLAPPASDGHPQGDRNQNGFLDAGDLILAFSDQVDDDGNGYVDDIAGWDFFKDDNDPYDDIRYGHGTGEAKHAAAATNNGIAGAGVCPLCRVMPLRVADSFVADVNSFGKALVYARDNGVAVVNAALGGIDMTSFAQSALDYAFEGGVVVVNAMADENARHHNFPATANHTLPVHAISVAGHSTLASSFLSYNPCTNYGGQNLLSATGEGCSSEATAVTAGIVGLLRSAALAAAVDPPLHAGEVQQLLITTADDIDVAESRKPGAEQYWSQPGFDQRFGYGRENANTAVERVTSGKIPPIVDIVSPGWFTILYKGRGAPVSIEGRIGAARATSYDYTVEWGPGVQPLDSEFHVIAAERNVDASIVTGQGGPIATIDPDAIDPKHVADPDSSRFGENKDAITVRIRAVAHYGGAVGDVVGKMHRTFYVHEDDALLPGFPVHIGASGEASPKLADIDGDGIRDIVYATSDGEVHVFKSTPDGPVELPGFPFRANRIDGLLSPPPTAATPVYLTAPGYGPGGVNPDVREAFLGAPAVADIDGDGSPDIVVTAFAGTIHAVDAKGAVKPGFPIRLPEVPSCPLDPLVIVTGPCMGEHATLARGAFAAPVLVDLDDDGKLDIVQPAFDGNIYAFHADGSPVSGYPVAVHYQGKLAMEPAKNRILTTPAAGDFNGDGVPELLVGSNEKLSTAGFSGAIYLLDGRGNDAPGGAVLPNWPVTMTSLATFPLVGEGVPNSGVIGRIDGELVAIMHGNGSAPMILPMDPGTQPLLNVVPTNGLPQRPDEFDPTKTLLGVDPTSKFGKLTTAKPDTMLPLFAQPSIGDLDQDGTIDVVAQGGSLKVAIAINPNGVSSTLKGEQLLAMWSAKTGAMLPASPIPMEDFTFLNAQAIVDLNGDDYPEVVSATSGYFVHAYDACGREAKGFPKFTGQWILTTPALGDLDGDGQLDLVVGTRNGWLYAWKTEAKTDAMIQWESFHHDNRNTGNIETPLEQGDPTRHAKTALTEATCKEPVKPSPSSPPPDQKLMISGGCDCGLAGSKKSNGDAAAALTALLAALGAALRRRASRRAV